MNQADLAARFHALHATDDPLVLYNCWDAGSARAVEAAGAAAIATGSHSVAAAHGYDDGEAIPLALLVTVTRRICASTPLPVSIDFEGGFAVAPDAVADNVRTIIDAGAVGINFEDQVVAGDGLHAIDAQVRRIRAIRDAADGTGVALFINARTDTFLQTPSEQHAAHVDDAIARGVAYSEAGANGFFVPGLVDADLIGTLCESVPLPVNVMMLQASPPIDALAGLGVRRVSYGPQPWRDAMQTLTAAAAQVYAGR